MRQLGEQVAGALADARAFEDLESYRRHLEERVAERTEELEKANTEKERLISVLRERSHAAGARDPGGCADRCRQPPLLHAAARGRDRCGARRRPSAQHRDRRSRSLQGRERRARPPGGRPGAAAVRGIDASRLPAQRSGGAYRRRRVRVDPARHDARRRNRLLRNAASYRRGARLAGDPSRTSASRSALESRNGTAPPSSTNWCIRPMRACTRPSARAGIRWRS